jgi:8-oxo-dGTP pyrophosphatase MutT (NUDIX family)
MELKQEISAGAVVYKKIKNEFYFLLVYSVKNKEWSFPKGHIEQNENEIETAKREIFEETGINNLNFIDGFKFTDSYLTKGVLPNTAGGIVKKNVIYYLCYTDSDYINPNNDEINNCKWFNFDQAIKILKFETQHKLLKQVLNLLKGEKNESDIK